MVRVHRAASHLTTPARSDIRATNHTNREFGTNPSCPNRRRERQPPAPRAASSPPPTAMSLAAIFVFLLVSALQLLDRYLDLSRKRGSHTDEQLKLRLEIKQLLKEASQLSTPSTFAQAAKLKRLAAAKEKELAKIQEQDIKGKQSLNDQYGKALLITKGNSEAIVVYGGDREMAWCEVMVQRADDAGGDDRVRFEARGGQRWLMRVEATEVRSGDYDM